MTEQEFHERRIMFVIKDGTLLLRMDKTKDSHYEWLRPMFGETITNHLIDACTRGYLLNNRAVFYKGTDFSHRVDFKSVRMALLLLRQLYEIQEIGIGCVFEHKSMPWPCKQVYTYLDFLAKMEAFLGLES